MLCLLIFLISLSEPILAVSTNLFSGSAESIPIFTCVTQIGRLVVFTLILPITLFSRKSMNTVELARFLLPLLILGYSPCFYRIWTSAPAGN